jgi:cobalt/nickel transport system permease protein
MNILHIRLHDPYIDKRSIVHKITPVVKFSSALILIILIVASPRTFWRMYGLIGVILISLICFSRIPIIFILKRLFLLEPFVLGVAFLSLFQNNGKLIFLGLVTKGTLSLLTMILLVATTRFNDLVHVLRRLHIPMIIVTTISLMYRYLFLLSKELNRLLRARSSRTFSPGKQATWHTFASVIGRLFISTSERAERIYAAMCARGWKL